MPESPLLFSVPACGSFLLCSQKVEESDVSQAVKKLRSRGAQVQRATARLGPQAGRRRMVLLKTALRSSFPRRRESTVPMTMGPRFRGDDINFQMGPRSPAFAEDKFRGDDGGFQNRGNKARMYMKTKNEVKMSMRMVGMALDEKPQSPNTRGLGATSCNITVSSTVCFRFRWKGNTERRQCQEL